MVPVRNLLSRQCAFWLTAGLTAGAANWACGVEPIPQQVFLQPVPASGVVQTQGVAPAQPQPLRTNTATNGAAPTAPGQKSEVQRQLEMLYQQEGREMPVMQDPQIQRQAPPAGQQPGIQAQPVSQTNPSAATAAQAQPAKKKTSWLQQINPFKGSGPKGPPAEPAEIQYNPARGMAAAPTAQPQPIAAGAQPQMFVAPTQSGAVNPQTGRPNYGQLFNQPQTFTPPSGAPTQGDPFVGTPVTVPAPVAGTPAPIPLAAPPAAFAAAQPVAPPAGVLMLPQNAASAAPQAGNALPMIDFNQPVQQAVPQIVQTPVAPPVAAAPLPSPYTGLGLNDPVPLRTAAVTPPPAAPAIPPAQTPVFVPPVAVAPALAPAAAPPVVAGPSQSFVPPIAIVAPAAQPASATPQPVAVAAPPVAVPQAAPIRGFFSDEEEHRSDGSVAAAPTSVSAAAPIPMPAAPPVVVAPPAAPVAVAEQVPTPPNPLPPLTFDNTAPAPNAPLVVQEAAPAPLPATIAQAAPELKPVPRPVDSAAATKMARIAARAGQPGLKGFCPVMLRDHRELIDAKPEFRTVYGNKIILLSSHEAKVVFESDPAKYAPALGGNDAVHFSQTGEELEGSLEYAVWYKGRLYMFASSETLESFIAAPSTHAGAE
jgi:YHS domain-containing protein